MAQAAAVERPKLRQASMIARPVWTDPAFEDPEAVMALVRKSAPYPLTAYVSRRDEDGRDVPWFRVFWAHSRQVKVKGAEPFFYNERFIEAAKTSFGAKVVIPSTTLVNVTTPMAGAPPHRDLPFFRGAERYPHWVLSAMGYSELFHDWAVPVASMLTWFYKGAGGDFEYWPDGADAPSQLVKAPLWNVGVVSDNEYMWHRVGGVGHPHEYKKPGELSRQARLHAPEGGGWEIHDRGQVEKLGPDQARVSILWKGYAFADQATADEYNNHTNDLDHEKIVDVFAADLRERGIPFRRPVDPMADPEWKSLIMKTYAITFKGEPAKTAEY